MSDEGMKERREERLERNRYGTHVRLVEPADPEAYRSCVLDGRRYFGREAEVQKKVSAWCSCVHACA